VVFDCKEALSDFGLSITINTPLPIHKVSKENCIEATFHACPLELHNAVDPYFLNTISEK